MRYRKVQVLDDLHVIGRHDDANVTKGLHCSALEIRDSYCHRTSLPRHPQCVQDVFGVSASAYGECDIARLDEIPELFRKDIFVA